jgi:hypothetical protein
VKRQSMWAGCLRMLLCRFEDHILLDGAAVLAITPYDQFVKFFTK